MEIKQKDTKYYIVSDDKKNQLGPFEDWQQARNKYQDLITLYKQMDDKHKELKRLAFIYEGNAFIDATTNPSAPFLSEMKATTKKKKTK